MAIDFNQHLRVIPDYPKPGIFFQDITTLLGNSEVFRAAVKQVADHYRNKGITKVVGIESRGFILGAAVAYELGVGLVPMRKKGKLPWKTYSLEYQLEYGTDTIEIHQDALAPTDKVLITDDIIATGGTAKASLDLVRKFDIPQENIYICFLLDIHDVPGKEKEALKKHGYYALI
ncbi:MAG: adenine phosphoribosyltransferase [Prevotellaceae bacterium]|jgi:adenine phosphoribosyltransferase|nr:adenine phosphoribosyltransferase [Prevotellaceae bacterium]